MPFLRVVLKSNVYFQLDIKISEPTTFLKVKEKELLTT